jgi:hypothetical protein
MSYTLAFNSNHPIAPTAGRQIRTASTLPSDGYFATTANDEKTPKQINAVALGWNIGKSTNVLSNRFISPNLTKTIPACQYLFRN